MYKKNSATWLFYVLLSIILTNLSFSAPAEKQENESKTMYETLLLKCPDLDKTDLHENFKDIFDNKCTNWTAINETKNLFSPGITYAQCLVLYESVQSFCTSFGERLLNFKTLIPTNASLSHESVEKICNISSSLSNTEHDLSNILHPISCALMCGNVSDHGLVVYDICKLSYYFGTFHVKEFLLNYNSIPKNATHDGSPLLDLVASVSDSKKPTLNETENKKSDGAQNPPNENLPKPIAPVPSNNEPALQPAAGAEPPANHLENLSYKKDADIKAEIPESEVQEKSGKLAKDQEPGDANLNSVNNKPDSGTPTKSKPEDADGEQKDTETNKKPAESDNKNAEKQQVETKSEEEAENAGDGAEDNFAEDKDEETDEKGEQKIIANNESEPSVKVDKPATVEQAVNSNNIPEDDMDGDSYFFSYFTVVMCLVVVAYVGYHNRQKILALVLEGKRGKRSGRQARRPNSANYHKLGSNLEEAISSSCKKNTNNIIY